MDRRIVIVAEDVKSNSAGIGSSVKRRKERTIINTVLLLLLKYCVVLGCRIQTIILMMIIIMRDRS